MYYNCGAENAVTGERYPSKKAMKEALAAEPAAVYFDGTAPAFQSVQGYRGDELPEGVKLVVIGPNPYTSRRWDANVERRTNGGLKVS
jgi:hypothetical protein